MHKHTRFSVLLALHKQPALTLFSHQTCLHVDAQGCTTYAQVYDMHERNPKTIYERR